MVTTNHNEKDADMKLFTATYTTRTGTETRTIEAHNASVALHKGLEIRRNEFDNKCTLVSVDPA